MDASEAVEYGRIHDQLYPPTVDVDDIYPAEGLDALRERGHNVTGRSPVFRCISTRMMVRQCATLIGYQARSKLSCRRAESCLVNTLALPIECSLVDFPGSCE